MSNEDKQLSKEVCLYCNEPIEVPYGYSIPCPKCGGLLKVFDEKKLESRAYIPTVQRGFRTSSLRNSRSQFSEPRGRAGSRVSGISYEDIGGLSEVIEKLDLVINGKEKYPELFNRLGGKRPRGILLTGPPGCGKTMLIRALAASSGKPVSLVQGAEIKGWRVGDSENNLAQAYERARPNGIFVLDEIDSIGSKRDKMINTTEQSIVSTLCSLLDGAEEKDEVIIIATTNRPYALDDALRRPGRFDLEIEILPPSKGGRKEIFLIHTRGMPLAEDTDLDELARKAHGFTGADIAGVCAQVNQELLEESVRKLKTGISQEQIAGDLIIRQSDFEKVIEKTVPSLLRGFSQEVSVARWEDIGGLEDIKEELQRIVIWPVKHQDVMDVLKMRLPKGMLLYGPPGCGKTLLARAVAGEIDYNFLVVNGPALVQKYVGATEEAVRELFWRARMARPCVVFIDELDAFAATRGTSDTSGVTDRTVGQLLTEMDGVLELRDVFIIGATNRKDIIDPALLRSGRIELEYEVTYPDNAARENIFRIHLRGVPLHDDVNFTKLASESSGRSGADIEFICTTAKRFSAERCIAAGEAAEKAFVSQDDLLRAIREVASKKKGETKMGFVR